MERWNLAYREAPEIFDAFTRAEDPDGRVVRCLVEQADLGGRSVLELGCGTGRYTRELGRHAGVYVALERSPGMLALALAGGGGRGAPHFLCARAERIPLRDRSIDRVVAGWVLVNMPPRVRTAALAEIDRVIAPGPGASTWLIENHWSGEFQALRGRSADRDRKRIERLIDGEGFEAAALIETRLRFPTAEECEQVLGYLCGDAVRARLRSSPKRELSHHVLILRRPARI